jgi:peptidoglycan/LPS O-acetylase OafA/YrhL
LPLTFAFAAASWHCIERPALTLIRRPTKARVPKAS